LSSDQRLSRQATFANKKAYWSGLKANENKKNLHDR
jgi:hypothetical protein